MTGRIGASGPHGGQPILEIGAPLSEATAAVVMIHGRGATAASILSLTGELRVDAVAFVAPQAATNTWYPHSFLEPIERNEPWLSSALAALDDVVRQIDGAGVPAEQLVLLGFSQGACLASEYVARNSRRYGGLVAFSGGLIGPPGTPRDYAGSLGGTPVFIGGSDIDAHIPLTRLEETAETLERLGGTVDLRIYPGMGHTINADEIAAALSIVQHAAAASET